MENIDWSFDIQEENFDDEFEGNEDFYNFLIENGILDKYINNVSYSGYRRIVPNLNKFLNETDKERYIIGAFLWDYEDVRWDNIHYKWLGIVNKNKKIINESKFDSFEW